MRSREMAVRTEKKVQRSEGGCLGSPRDALLKLSKISSGSCFCLRGTIKPEHAFGPWGSEFDTSDSGDFQGKHSYTGEFIIDYLKQQKNTAQKPAATKKPLKHPRSLLHHIGYYPSTRTTKQMENRNIAAFKHLSSYEEYADYYRMSKEQHYFDLINPIQEKQDAAPGNGMWSLQNIMKNGKPVKLLESFRINPCIIPTSGALCNQMHCQEIPVKTQENFYNKTEQNSMLPLPFLSINKVAEMVNQPCCQAIATTTKAQAGQNPELPLPLLNIKDKEAVDTSEKFWMPNDAVFQHRNFSASMHHSRGYYSNCKRPVCSQQTTRNVSLLRKRHPVQPRKHANQVRTHPICCSHFTQARLSDKLHFNGAAAAAVRNQDCVAVAHDMQLAVRQSRPFSYKPGHFLPSSMNSSEATGVHRALHPRISKASIFFSENDRVKISREPGDDSKLPKLSNKFRELSLQDTKSDHTHLPDIGSKLYPDLPREALSAVGYNYPSSSQEAANGTTNSPYTATLPPATADSVAAISQHKCGNTLGLKSPKKWEEEYLHQAPRSFIFSRKHMLFSIESVNKRLLENGITKPAKKERSWLQPPKRTRHVEDKHRTTLDDGEVEAPFGTVEKKDRSKCFIRSMQRQKSKRVSKIITGRSGLSSNVPVTSQKDKITLHGRSYLAGKRDSQGSYSEDELTSTEFSYE